MDRGLALVLTLLAGGFVAVQPPANALLSRHTGSLGAATVSLGLSLALVAFLLVAAGQVGDLRGISEFRPVHALGGVSGAAIVVVSLIAVKPLGAGGVAAALVAMQLIVSALLDRFGAFGLTVAPLDLARVSGIVLLIVGTLLVTSR